MKLELKHLAAYLPYGVRFDGKPKGWVSFTDTNNMILCPIDLVERWQVVKPILRPLSDLIKEIEVNREKFVPMMYFFMLINDHHLVPCNYGNLDYSENNVSFGCDDEWNYWISFNKELITLSYDILEQRFALMSDWDVLDFNYIEMHEKLKEWHFDVFGLIDNGLAIDINTIK